MIAFLKRRWILLSYTLLFFGCTMCNGRIGYAWPSRMILFSLQDGRLGFGFMPNLELEPLERTIHAPMFGTNGPPLFINHSDVTGFVFPIGILLTVVIGCIVLRELRWRDNRAKAVELQQTT